MVTDHAVGALTSLPVRPLWLLRVFAISVLKRVPAYALAGGAAMFLAARFLGWSFGDGALAAIGAWSFTFVLAALGIALGSLLGLATTGEDVLRAAESDIRNWLMHLPSGAGEELFPPVDLQELRNVYEKGIEQLYRTTVGRIPLPGVARRAVQSQFREALLDEFLADCGQRGVTRVGFPEVRDFMLRKALPIVTRPAHAQFRIWTVLFLALLGVGVAVPALIGLLRHQVELHVLITGVFGLLGVMVLAIGLPRASSHVSPWRYRLGIVLLSVGLIAWPIVWIQLWPLDIGMVWIVVLAVTIWTLHRAARLAFLEADQIMVRAS